MDTTEIFMLDTLLKSLSLNALEQAKEKLLDNLTKKAIEIADLVGINEEFGLSTLLKEREILKDYISRIDVQMNIIIHQKTHINHERINE
jgi:hypothetical protein